MSSIDFTKVTGITRDFKKISQGKYPTDIVLAAVIASGISQQNQQSAAEKLDQAFGTLAWLEELGFIPEGSADALEAISNQINQLFGGSGTTGTSIGQTYEAWKASGGTPSAVAGMNPLMALISAKETGVGPDAAFDTVFGGKQPLIDGKPLSQCTIGQVIEYQRANHSAKWNAFPVGHLQFVRTTLEGVRNRAGLNDSNLFSTQNQIDMGQILLNDAGYQETMRILNSGASQAQKEAAVIKMGHRLSGTWAVLQNPDGGRAADHGGTVPFSVVREAIYASAAWEAQQNGPQLGAPKTPTA
jgi:hypothetical protein